jgi:aryl-alcohol dehydrogenase-like predicted oxidoreductase
VEIAIECGVTKQDPDFHTQGEMKTICRQPSPLTLGTVQLGLPYGIANASGLPDMQEAAAILDTAWSLGISTFDTARAYGQSEERIGRWRAARPRADMTIVTKFSSIPEDAPAGPSIKRSVETSRKALGSLAPDLLLAHRADDLFRPGAIEALAQLVSGGSIGAFGASAYSPATAARLLHESPISALQVPLSIVDRRFVDAGVLEAAREKGVLVFARSAFLQGALLMDVNHLPAHLSALGSVILQLREIAEGQNLSLAELALLAVRDTPGVSSIVVGAERPEQLGVHARAMGRKKLTSSEVSDVQRIVSDLPEHILDPSQWPR